MMSVTETGLCSLSRDVTWPRNIALHQDLQRDAS